MEQLQIGKELNDVMLCVETLLSLIRKGAPLNPAEAELLLKFTDTLTDGVSRTKHAPVLRCESLLRTLRRVPV
jgi:hypothetical protein